MKFVDLKAEYWLYRRSINDRWLKIKDAGCFLFGREVEELETNFPKLIGKKRGVTVKSGTDALLLVLGYVHCEGVPIILPNFGAYPTAVACRHITDQLFYVDVDASMTMDVNKLPDVQNGIVVAVHLFGNNCRMKEIMEYARANGHIVVEDCAQSTGSGSGRYGDYSVFSFYPTKPLASMGDGGMICSDHDLGYFRKARFYGVDEGILGFNSRMDEFQAAVVNSKIDGFMELNQRRIEIAERYKEIVRGIKVNSSSIYHQFTIRFRNRDGVVRRLGEIPYMIHYRSHVNEIPVLRGRFTSEVGYRVNDTIVSLPVHPHLTDAEVEQVEDFLYENRKEEIEDI